MAQTSTAFKASPSSFTFSYQEGDAKLPAAQTLAVSGPAATAFTGAVTTAPWLTVSPLSGTVPVSAKVVVNPTSLAVGTYSATITLTTTGSTPQTAAATVTLTIKAAPSTLTATPSPVAISYTRGGATPSPVTLSLASSGAVLSYSITAAGGTWLGVSPKSGIVFPAFPGAVSITASPSGLAPGAYKGTLTIAAPQASNKSQTVTVNLTVLPGAPTLTSVWPVKVTQGAAATTLTLRGTNFYAGSVVKAGTVTLATTVIGADALTAVLPADLLGDAGDLSITVSNPGSGGGDSGAFTFQVAAAAPVISAVLNAASFQSGAVAPGEMVTIFGTRLGPDTLATFVAPAAGSRIATTLEGTTVTFGSTQAPVIFTSARQVAVMVPYDVAGRTTVAVKVANQGVESDAVTLSVAASAPGIFSAAGAGSGQAAAFNYDEQDQSYTVNSDSSLAAKGGVIVFYATGEGVTTPAGLDGQIVTQAASAVNSTLGVQIGGASAMVLYAGGVVGLVSGIIQINARIPSSITGAKAVPVVLTVNGVSSPTGITIGVK